MGDFNDPAEDSEAYRILTGSGLVDALAPRDRAERRLRTFTGFDPDSEGEGEQIDWVLVTPDITVADAWVVAGPPGEASPSDHRAGGRRPRRRTSGRPGTRGRPPARTRASAAIHRTALPGIRRTRTGPRALPTSSPAARGTHRRPRDRLRLRMRTTAAAAQVAATTTFLTALACGTRDS